MAVRKSDGGGSKGSPSFNKSGYRSQGAVDTSSIAKRGGVEDDGFDYVRNFWKQKNIEVKKIVNLSMMEAETEQEEQIKKLMELLGDDSREEAQAVSEIIEKFKTKQAINNALVKRYDSTKGGKVYKAIKPLLKDKN